MKYYVSNGKAEVEFGWILKEAGEPTDDKVVVIDELANIAEPFMVSKDGVVEISKEDYEKILNLNLELSESDVVETYEIFYEIDRLLKNHYGLREF